MQTIGERLEEARKRKGISIREAAEATKIRSEYLHKLESNSFDLNLPDIYIRGFLHNYAVYLKLNPDKLLADYKTLVPAEGRGSRRENRENYGRMDLGQPARPTTETASAPPETTTAASEPARPSFPRSAGSGASPIDSALLIKGGIVVATAILLVVAIVFGFKAISGGSAKPATEIKAVAEQTITLTARDTVRVKLVQELDGTELFQGALIKDEPRTFPKRGSLLLTATALQNIDIDIDGKRRPNPYSGYNRVQIP
jgi:cytoskeletal protein RodZ